MIAAEDAEIFPSVRFCVLDHRFFSAEDTEINPSESIDRANYPLITAEYTKKITAD